MGTRLILTACIVSSGLLSAQPKNLIKNEAHIGQEIGIREDIQNYLRLFIKKDPNKTEIYRAIIKGDEVKEQQVFHAMKDEVQLAQQQNAYKRRNLFNKNSYTRKKSVAAIKRDVDESAYDEIMMSNDTGPETAENEVMRKLRELWEAQRDYLATVQEVVANLSKAGHQVRIMGWILNDAEWLIERQLDELTILPKTIAEAMRDVLDDDDVGHQERNWEKIEECLNKHYRYVRQDDLMQLMRSTIETARADFSRRRKEVKSLAEKEIPEDVGSPA